MMVDVRIDGRLLFRVDQDRQVIEVKQKGIVYTVPIARLLLDEAKPPRPIAQGSDADAEVRHRSDAGEVSHA